jgi:glutaminyl-tRNA synthetase
MPTISGLRRRGYTPESIRDFCERIGVARANSLVDIAMLEHCLREDLNSKAPRVMAVLNPIKVVITNYPEGQVEYLEAENNPENPEAGTRTVPFAREIYIEQEDFMENPPGKFFRLAPDREVRLKHAYIIKCTEVIKDDSGEILEIHCTYDPESKSGGLTSGRKVKGTLHWVSCAHAQAAEIRLYDYLLKNEDSDSSEEEKDEKDFLSQINPQSKIVFQGCKVEPSLTEAEPGTAFQFLRQGYFCADIKDHKAGKLVFNRTLGLRDSWAKANKA